MNKKTMYLKGELDRLIASGASLSDPEVVKTALEIEKAFKKNDKLLA